MDTTRPTMTFALQSGTGMARLQKPVAFPPDRRGLLLREHSKRLVLRRRRRDHARLQKPTPMGTRQRTPAPCRRGQTWG